MIAQAFHFRVLHLHVLALCCTLLLDACQNETATTTKDDKVAPTKAEPSKVEPTTAEPTKAQPLKTAAPILNIDLFCPEICKRTRQLACRASDRCDLVCRTAFAQMPCPEQLQPAMECALSQPVSAWICSPDGFGAVKDGPCDREQTAYDTCLNAIK